ncbi:MAG: serine/threonine protein kinase [Labilithrix sp.]|nr:serine/threonine protein kinase [Labilithrix sp.]
MAVQLAAAKLTDFALGAPLGSGTTAKVYDAVQIASGKPVAIKMLEPSAGASAAGSEMRERFAREAVLLAGVTSKHVGGVLGFGFERGQPFLVLERLDGETLDAKLRREGPVSMPVAVRWIEQLLVGVRDCHDQQIIHRDIKPSNLFLHRAGFEETVKLIDFGVARLREISDDGSPESALTSRNHLLGSMGYMAPEQFADPKSVGFTADLYAVGVVVFRTLTGRLPFVSRSLDVVIRMKTEQPAPTLSENAGLPRNVLLDWFAKKAMARAPGDRFQSAREMLEQWWNVMASIDEDGATDVMRGIGRVDESYAGRLHRPGDRREVEEPSPLSEEERTLRRLAPAFPACSSGPDSELTELTELTALDALDDLDAPRYPAAEGAPPATQHEEMPTRTDPNLRRLVEQELALQRNKKAPDHK